jgi:thiol-disulfide isomerase/thioredoxin
LTFFASLIRWFCAVESRLLEISSVHRSRPTLFLLAFGLALLLIACQALQNLAPGQAPVASSSPTAAGQPSGGTLPADGYPAAGEPTQTRPAAAGATAYPAPGDTTPAATRSPQAPASDEPTATTVAAYPGPVTPPAEPDLDVEASPSPTSQAESGALPYPGPGAASPTLSAASPTVTGVFAETPTPPGQLTPTPGGLATATQVYLATATGLPGITPSPTLVVTPYLSATPTLPPSPTPSLAPTFTPLPTATRTPVPPPPWISSGLKATDPETVELASGRVQLVEFFAFWCGPCQAMAPLLSGLEAQYGDEMNFIYLDIDDPANQGFIQELDFRQEPHFFLLDGDGAVLREWIGYVDAQDFIDAIEGALGY